MKKLSFILVLLITLTSAQTDDDYDRFYDDFKEYVRSSGVYFPEVVIRQALAESAYFTSNIWIENNNPFGMHHPSVRATVSLGIKNNAAYYKDWKDAVKDMLLYQCYYSERIELCKTEYDYMLLLDKIYCPRGKGEHKYSQMIKEIRI